MLALLGVCTILALLLFILFRITSVLIALILVPVIAALVGGFGREIGRFAMEGIGGVTPVAALLAFAVIYFGVMNDAGLFDPIIRTLVRAVGTDPVKIAVGTTAIATIAHLDGAGASTFMVTIPAMLPLYERVGMSPLTLTCITAMAAGTTNMLPWTGPTTRAAASLQTSTADLFTPLLPTLIGGMLVVFLFAIRLGRLERRRLSVDGLKEAATGPDVGAHHPASAARIGWLWYFNALLTIVALAALFVQVLPPAIVFIVASAIALIVNYPSPHAQRERLTAHGNAAMMMVTTIFAAGIFTGILTKSGMLGAMSSSLVAALPQRLLLHLPVAMGVTSMPLSLAFDPDSFYFGLLPILAHASQTAGGSAVEIGRAALLGQMTTGFPVSPLTPSTFLLVGLANVDLADHQRRTIPYVFAVTLAMTAVAILTGAIRW